MAMGAGTGGLYVQDFADLPLIGLRRSNLSTDSISPSKPLNPLGLMVQRCVGNADTFRP